MITMADDTIQAVIIAVFSTSVFAALIGWWKERKKDTAVAKLTDVQTLQAKLAYVESVAEYLRKHNDSLQADYDELEQRHRTVRNRVTELEEELDRVKRSAAQTQAECESLGKRLQSLLEEA